MFNKRKKSVQLDDYEIKVEDEPAVTMYGLDNMPIRTSSETYRDIRNQLWPSQVRLRKLSDLRKHSITDQKGPICTGPIYNIASNKSMAPVPEAPIKELDEHTCEIPWIQEMRRMTVNPAPLSESHLQHLRKCQAERRKKLRHHNRHHEESDDSDVKSRTTSECNDDDCENDASCCSSSASSDDDDEDEDEREDNDCKKSEFSNDIASEMKTKLLLERSKKLAKSVSIIKPQQTISKTYKLRSSKSFPELKLIESVYKQKVEGVDGKVGRNRKISTTGMAAPKRRSSTITIPAVTNTRKTSTVTRNNLNTATQKGSISDGKTTGPSTKLKSSDTVLNKRKTGATKKTLRRANTDVISKDKVSIPRVRRKSMITIDELVELHGNQPNLSIKRR